MAAMVARNSVFKRSLKSRLYSGKTTFKNPLFLGRTPNTKYKKRTSSYWHQWGLEDPEPFGSHKGVNWGNRVGVRN